MPAEQVHFVFSVIVRKLLPMRLNDVVGELFLFDTVVSRLENSVNIGFGLVSVWSVIVSHTCCKLRSTFSRASICRRCWSCLLLIASSMLGSH